MLDQILVKSWIRVSRKLARGVLPMWSRMTKKRRDLVCDLQRRVSNPKAETCHKQNLLPVLQEQLQVDLKHSLEQAHVCALVQTNLVLPDVDNQNFARG